GRGRSVERKRRRSGRGADDSVGDFDRVESHTDVVAGLVPATPNDAEQNRSGWPGQARPRLAVALDGEERIEPAAQAPAARRAGDLSAELRRIYALCTFEITRARSAGAGGGLRVP